MVGISEVTFSCVCFSFHSSSRGKGFHMQIIQMLHLVSLTYWEDTAHSQKKNAKNETLLSHNCPLFSHDRAEVIRTFPHCDRIPDLNTFREKRSILTHSIRCFNPWSAGSITFRPMERRTMWRKNMMAETVQFMVAMKGRRKTGSTRAKTCPPKAGHQWLSSSDRLYLLQFHKCLLTQPTDNLYWP